MYSILIDEMDWEDELIGPTYILGANYESIPVFIGIADSASEEAGVGFCVLWVTDEDYEKIDHTTVYVLFHSIKPISISEMPQEIIEFIEKARSTKEDDSNVMNRQHVHVTGPQDG